MNEPAILPSSEQPEHRDTLPGQSAPAEPPRSDSPQAQRSDRLPLLCLIGFVLLAAAIAYVWASMVPADRLAAETHDYNALNQRVAELDTRINRVDQKPPPVSAADLAKLNARLDELDGKLASQTQLATQLDAVSGRLGSLSNRSQSDVDGLKSSLDNLKQQLGSMTAQVDAAKRAAGQVTELNQRVGLISKLQAASTALNVGHSLGDIPGAPPTLQRYAHTPPPTEAQLRESYPQAQALALSKQQPDNASAPFMDRVLERAQGLVTVRRGDQVVVGDTTSMALSQAQGALEQGDLPAVVKALKQLKGEPAQAMAPWLADAEGLVNARLALSQMAEQS